MARKGRITPRTPEPLPEPLPPDKRTIGQLVAETVNFYRHHFFQALPLGIAFAAVTQLTAVFVRDPEEPYGHPPQRGFHHEHSLVGGGVEMVMLLGALLLTASYIVAIVLVTEAKPTGRQVAMAYAAGFLIYLPVPLLAQLLVLPAVLYLAVVGWVMPAILVEGRSFRDAFARSFRLARTDFVHAAGGLATLVILFVVVRLMMLFLIHVGAETGRRSTVAAADLVLSPILFLGSVIVFIDLVARDKAKEQ